MPDAVAPPEKITATVLPDRSIYSTGKEGRGIYSIEVKTNLRGITGIRLEAITDERLPHGGPGLAPDGNFVLNQLEVFAESIADPKENKKIALHQAKADFNQENFPVAKLVDGNINDGPGLGRFARRSASRTWPWWSARSRSASRKAPSSRSRFIRNIKTASSWAASASRFRWRKPPLNLGLPDDAISIVRTPAAGTLGQGAGNAGQALPSA